MEDILVYFSIKYESDWDKIYKAISRKEVVNKVEVEETIAKLKNNYLTIMSDNYPEFLKNVIKPPFVIFYKGNLDLLYDKRLKIAVIGSRDNSQYGSLMCEKIVSGLVKKDVCIVSGFARGIDSIAHTSTIDGNGKTIAIFGCGIDLCYPISNKTLYQNILDKGGLFISEYPSIVKVSKDKFPLRNRIIAGLCHGIAIMEAKKKSGTMITVREGLDIGKDIFCVPQQADIESGCNYLIKNGAKLIENANDIMEEYNYIQNNKIEESID